MMIKEPFYELEVKTRNCSIEILINDLPVFSFYEEGNIAVDYPINTAIIRNGDQSMQVRLFSQNGNNISNDAACELKVYVKEANIDGAQRDLIYNVPDITFFDKTVPVFIEKLKFKADIAYNNNGWYNSIDLKTIDENRLFNELKEYMLKITSIYNLKDAKGYNTLYSDRIKEHNNSFYLTPSEIRDNEEEIFSGVPQKIEGLDIDLYKLVFYGDNKLVSLQMKNQPPGFVFESENKDEYGFTEMVLFHKKDISSPLTPIR
ncbi:hypothetical protein [Elizabethkingia occulta]|nr:hypothetical protein [Elizabethkingia occulta]